MAATQVPPPNLHMDDKYGDLSLMYLSEVGWK